MTDEASRPDGNPDGSQEVGRTNATTKRYRGGHPNTMTDIITVRVEDTHLRPNARPISQELVDEITESIQLVGFLPSKAVDVRRDGDIYWIIDGGHRRAAAIAAGVTEIPAVVDCLDDAGVLTVEGAANLQRADTEEERWARAQQFFALGEAATPQAIAVATGIDVETQAKARRVLKKLADPTAAEDVTLDQALAADEFADDDEAFGAIMTAGANWYGVFRQYKDEQKRLAAHDIAKQAIEDAGCKVIERSEAGLYNYLGQAPASHEPRTGATHATYDVYDSTPYINWYRERGEEIVDLKAQAQREEADRKRAEFNAGIDAAREARHAFLGELLGLALPAGIASVIAKLLYADTRYFEPDFDTVAKMLGADEAGLEVMLTASPTVLLVGAFVEWRDNMAFTALNSTMSIDEDDAQLLLEWMDALQSAGYEPTEFEATLIAKARETVAAEAAGDGDE